VIPAAETGGIEGETATLAGNPTPNPTPMQIPK